MAFNFSRKSPAAEPDADDRGGNLSAPRFTKGKSASARGRRQRKTGQVSPAQKTLMSSSRPLSGGRR
jgi:hypothetical protein